MKDRRFLVILFAVCKLLQSLLLVSAFGTTISFLSPPRNIPCTTKILDRKSIYTVVAMSAESQQDSLQDTNENVHETYLELEEEEEVTSSTSLHAPTTTDTNDAPIWDAVAQVYIGGRLPENVAISQMIARNNGILRIFGYGSLCWNPGTGPLSLAENKLGRTRGYRRCWAQKSTDHRGVPIFPGIVCTLLKDEEYYEIIQRCSSNTNKSKNSKSDNDSSIRDEVSLAEGVLYNVPPELVTECLAELDFREKGGYARDIINVIEDDTGNSVEALLYRGTPDNPAIWPRVMTDLKYAAAVMAIAEGPSGKNKVYLHQLDKFLESASHPDTLAKFDDTFKLEALVNQFARTYDCHFLVGSGSNQHNQLLLRDAQGENVDYMVNGDEAHEMKEILICTNKLASNVDGCVDKIIQIFAGGGHSAVLSKSGRLYAFGWNENGQLGFRNSDNLPVHIVGSSRQHVLQPLCTNDMSNGDYLPVEQCALGFSHTLVIERGTKRLYCYGDNERGQVLGIVNDHSKVFDPTTPSLLKNAQFVHVAAGLFHSAAVTFDGYLTTFGCTRFGQCIEKMADDDKVARWKPTDGSNIIKAACGRRHTLALDDRGRVWSFGDNKYGQLGRAILDKSEGKIPTLIDMDWNSWQVQDINCGWSHCVIKAKQDNNTVLFGWGRNDKGQLGFECKEGQVKIPVKLTEVNVQAFTCGSECTYYVDDNDGEIFGTGWNEHGNLALGHNYDSLKWTCVNGARVTIPPTYSSGSTKIAIAAGGSHALAMQVAQQ